MVSAWFSMPTPLLYWIPPTRSLQAGWKRMTSRIPGYPWKLTGTPDGAAAAAPAGWLTEAARMPRNEGHFVRITACSFLAFWHTSWAATEDWLPCFGSWSCAICRVMFRVIRGWCSVFCGFCCYLVVWWSIWPTQEKLTSHWWEMFRGWGRGWSRAINLECNIKKINNALI